LGQFDEITDKDVNEAAGRVSSGRQVHEAVAAGDVVSLAWELEEG